MNRIRADRLTFSYPGQVAPALRDICFCAPEGKITGIIGPNGSGKTTLLKCISGYFIPDHGEVLINERDVRRLSTRDIARSMALVQQQNPSEYDFSVMDIVMTGRNPYVNRFHGESEEDYRIARE